MNRTTLTTIATATHPRRIHLIILRLSVKYGYMEIMMRAVIAFQLTIGKRENPFRSLLKRVFFKNNIYLFYKRVDYYQIPFRFILKTQQFIVSFFVDLNLHVLYIARREEIIV